MGLALLLVIYLTFVSLGLPDSVLGSSFPAIAGNLGLSSDLAGYIGMVVTAGTILSAFMSSFILQKLKAKYLVAFSVLLTASGLLAFSFVAKGYAWAFFLVAILLGLGAGGIDAALNNFVALHYKPIHMNWLHCSWGIGASTGPLILGAFIDPVTDAGWNDGVRVLAYIQFGIALLIFLTLPLWEKVAAKNAGKKTLEDEAPVQKGDHRKLLREPVFYFAVVGFFAYCSLETTSGFWSGFLSLKIKPKGMIRLGEGVLVVGALIALLPGVPWQVSAAGFILIGLGCAPIYPSIILLTPYRFSKRLSQTAMSMEMAVAYLGNLVVSPLFGLVAKSLGDAYILLPFVTLFFALLMVVVHEFINGKLKKRDAALSEEEKEAYGVNGR